MDNQTRDVEDLERVLVDGSAEPINISYAVIKHITKNFAQVIGHGGFGIVYLGGLQNGMVAVKKLYTSNDFSDKEFLNEITCLKKARHENIVRLLGYCAELHGHVMEYNGRDVVADVQQRFLCYEYVPNGTLHHFLTEKTEWNVRYHIFKGICQGLHYLHRERIIHLDLKPGNVLLGAEMEPKIIDFATSKCIGEERSTITTKHISGTPGYIPPELLDGGQISFKSDIYSLGVILINLLTERAWNNTGNWHETLNDACQQMNICIEIAKRCVDEDPYRRPSIYDIIQSLNATEMMVEKFPPIILEPRNDPTSSLYQVVQRFHALSAKTPVVYLRTEDAIYKELVDLESVLEEGGKKPRELSYQLLKFITGNFSDKRMIDKGGYSNIYKGIIGCVAVKRLSGKNRLNELMFHQEIKCTAMAQHINVVRFLGYCSYTEEKEVEFGGKTIIQLDVVEKLLCFEYLRNGSLRNYLSDASRRMDWRERYQIIKGICEGLHHLHEKKILHLDIKPENILLDSNMVPKIADFGQARCFRIDQSRTSTSNCVGTMGYIAPETIHQLITLKSDIFSLGVLISEILTGKAYSSIEDALENWRKVLETSFTDNLLDQVRLCAEISIDCQDDVPSKRPHMQRIINMLVENECRDRFIRTRINDIPVAHAERACNDLQQFTHQVPGNKHNVRDGSTSTL